MKTLTGLLCLLLLLLGAAPAARAATIAYVPMDDRPVNLEYVADTVKAAGMKILTPDAGDVAGRQRSGDVPKLWDWVFRHAVCSDAMALSSDSLIYGGLVASRTHYHTEGELAERVEKFRELKHRFPALRLYVFGTVMRTPHASAGATEPSYYETFGPMIFRITALEDKRETANLTAEETAELARLLAAVPAEDMADWRTRRALNYRVNEQILQLAKDGVLEYFLLGRDDSSPLSSSHQEARHLARQAAGLGSNRFLSIPGADNLGICMVARAINAGEYHMPIIRVLYGLGTGDLTVASYEDQPLGVTVPQHITAAGGVKLDGTENPDLVLAVNTPFDGLTKEANQPGNTADVEPLVKYFVRKVKAAADSGQAVAVADVAFANGADNSLMTELKRQGLLDRLAAYSGWNTAGNTIGFAIGQGIMARQTPDPQRKRLLAVRYLDDWGYQANIREQLYQEVVYPRGNNGQWLNELNGEIVKAALVKVRRFAADNLWKIPQDAISVDFPWNRMFEVGVHIR